jgi:hypothetical protein
VKKEGKQERSKKQEGALRNDKFGRNRDMLMQLEDKRNDSVCVGNLSRLEMRRPMQNAGPNVSVSAV